MLVPWEFWIFFSRSSTNPLPSCLRATLSRLFYMTLSANVCSRSPRNGRHHGSSTYVHATRPQKDSRTNIFYLIQDKDAFLQAAKRTPVDLQEWAISMMERHNRKSYLAPPAPKSLKDTTNSVSNSSSPAPMAAPPAPAPKPAPISKSSRTPQAQSPYHPSSGEIPLNIANDFPTPNRHYGSQPQAHYYYSNSNSRSTQSPPPPSLEHLSLETKDDESRYGRRPMRHLGDPVSAIEAPSRPFMSPRSVSSHNTKSRTNLTSTTLPIRAAPPPSHAPPPPPSQAPPPPPVPAGGSWRGYPGQTPSS